MVDNNEEKLEKFQNSCNKLAEMESEIITEKINKEINDDTNEEIKEYEEERLIKYEDKLKKIEQKYNTDIFNLNNNARYKLVEKEEEAKEEIRNDVLNKIKEFKQSENYFSFLIKNINEAIEKLNIKTEDIVKIYLVKSDIEKYKTQLQNSFKYKFETINESYIGGSRCTNETQKIAIDNTLQTLINEKFKKYVEEF